MSGYILCQMKKAKRPYYIESVGINLYSMEELSYFLANNLYLLDKSVFNEDLCLWIREEFQSAKLSAKLYSLLEKWRSEDEINWADVLIPILKETHYYNIEEYRKLQLALATFAGQSKQMRLKLKGDCLFLHEKYQTAIETYTRVLKKKEGDEKSRFVGSIYNNMGCSYMRMFQIKEAVTCFYEAYECIHSRETLKSYLYASYILGPSSAYEELIKKMRVDEDLLVELNAEIASSKEAGRQQMQSIGYEEAKEALLNGETEEYKKTLENILGELRESYHKNIGM